jgi:DNA-binding beta-propeller fold protein YncE/mono/diheme cytochrome c family protein
VDRFVIRWTRLSVSSRPLSALASILFLLAAGCTGFAQPASGARTGSSSGAASSGGAPSSGSTGGSSGDAAASSGGGTTSGGGTSSGAAHDGPVYRSPYAVAYSADSTLLAVTDATAGELVLLDARAGTSLRSVKLRGQPRGLAWSGAGRVLVAEYGAGTLAEVNASDGAILRRLETGPKPTDVVVAADGASVLVPDFGRNQVLVLDGTAGKTRATIPVAPYPFAVALAPGGSTAVVSHLLASGDATQPDAAASITVLDVATAKVTATVRLPFGSSSARGVRCSPDGKWAYAVHTLGRTTVPTTHLLRGWINTNALSIIDLASRRLYATVLLDRLTEGSADPWGLEVSQDGKSLWASAAGAHTVIRVDLALLHELLAGRIPAALVGSGKKPTATDRFKDGYKRPLSDVWFEIAADPTKRTLLADDLGALYGAGALQVIRLGAAQGPRGVALAPDGKQLAVALYFAGQVGLLGTGADPSPRFLSVGTQPEETWARQGERLFHDASNTLQGWLSCATCHPDARSDGLNWDLLNDGAGNAKNTKSMLYSANTPPAMAHGVRANAGVAITAGFKFIKFVLPAPPQELAVATYLNALAGEPDPYRTAGARSAAAQRGEAVFVEAGCAACHGGRYYTDLKTYDVGTRNGNDTRPDFDTPTLAELWRTAPYLHDGSAATLRDVLTTRNAGDRHGKTSSLTRAQLDDLVQYLLELEPPAPERVDLFPGADAAPPRQVFRGEDAPPNARGGLDLTDPRLAVLDRILFIKRDFLPTDDHGSGGHMCDQYHGFNARPGGGLFVLEDVLSGNPTERNVLASSTCANGPHQGKKLEGGGFLSPDLHPDGKQILFAYTDIGRKGTWDESSTFHLFKVNADGTGLTQLTEGPHNDFDPTWLPDGRIVFISDRRGGFGRCHPRPVPVYTLYVMNADGTGVEPLSLHETNEWQPSVDRSGLLLYTRWDYVDRGANQVHNAWITTPDGLDARAVVGNYSTRANVTPRMVMNLRAIPGTNKLVGTAAAHHQQAYGSLVIVDPDVEDDDGMAPYTVLTRDAGFPEATVDRNRDLKYATAWPIDEDRFLVVHDPQSNEHGLTNKRFAIYLIDRQGNKKLLHRDANRSCLDPIPLAPRPAPPVITPSRTGRKTDPGEVLVLNVYDSTLPFPAGVEIKALRVVQVFPKSTPNTIAPRKGHGAIQYNDQNGRGSLGTVPVEKDGSARFLVPPGKPVYFQALDADGLVVQSMRSATYVVPGGPRLTCQGCHERRYRAPRPRAAMPAALSRPPSVLQPEPDGSLPLSFARLIQPLLEKRCRSCHEGSSRTFSLGAGNWQGDGDRFFASYQNLKPFASYYNFNDAFGPTVTTPGEFGARRSRLYPLLAAGHQGLTLSTEELRTIALWLDLNSDMFSDDVKRDAQARGEVITPSVE